jgi:hypothetical protein
MAARPIDQRHHQQRLLSRRVFLKMGAAGGAALAAHLMGLNLARARAGAQRSRVVWVEHGRAALGWSADYAGRVDARAAQEMLDRAITRLAGETTVSDAWARLFGAHNGGEGYQPGQKIAVKLNFNNTHVDIQHNPNLPVVLALLHQLVDQVGISQAHIVLYDSSRLIPDQFRQGIVARYPQVALNPPSAASFRADMGLTRLTALLDEASYLINMPLLRTHSGAGLSLSFKNHVGSVETPSSTHDDLARTDPGQNSLVRLNSHPLIAQKTLLVVADGIYGLRERGPSEDPGGQYGLTDPFPNSLFVSTDPLAVDSVMADYLQNRGANFNVPWDARMYMSAAAAIGLGNHETRLDYQYRTIDLLTCRGESCWAESGLP